MGKIRMITSLIARYTWPIALAVTLAVGLMTWDSGRKAKWTAVAVEQERASVELKATVNVQKADAARRAVDALPPDRLRDKYCRDCR